MLKLIILGATYWDKVTGFQGVATAKASYLTGCDRVLLTGTLHSEAATQDYQENWFDINRLGRLNNIRVVRLDSGNTVLDAALREATLVGGGDAPPVRATPPT